MLENYKKLVTFINNFLKAEIMHEKIRDYIQRKWRLIPN